MDIVYVSAIVVFAAALAALVAGCAKLGGPRP